MFVKTGHLISVQPDVSAGLTEIGRVDVQTYVGVPAVVADQVKGRPAFERDTAEPFGGWRDPLDVAAEVTRQRNLAPGDETPSGCSGGTGPADRPLGDEHPDAASALELPKRHGCCGGVDCRSELVACMRCQPASRAKVIGSIRSTREKVTMSQLRSLTGFNRGRLLGQQHR